MKSIIQKNRECYFCGNRFTDMHHVRLGNCSRKKAEEYGLYIYLCRICHMELHINETLKRSVQQHAQKKLEDEIGHEEYMKIFKKDYLCTKQ